MEFEVEVNDGYVLRSVSKEPPFRLTDPVEIVVLLDAVQPEPAPTPTPDPGDCEVNRLNAMVGAQVIRLTKTFVEIEDGQEIEFMRRLSRALELLEASK